MTTIETIESLFGKSIFDFECSWNKSVSVGNSNIAFYIFQNDWDTGIFLQMHDGKGSQFISLEQAIKLIKLRNFK